jgi:hypothetical protein
VRISSADYVLYLELTAMLLEIPENLKEIKICIP